MKRRFHEIGQDGSARYFELCGDESGQVIRGEHAVSGRPAPFGSELAMLTPEPDGQHFSIEVVSQGPCQVATESYRRGWEMAFASVHDDGDDWDVSAAGGVN